MGKVFAIVMLAGILAGCAPTGSFCKLADPIYPAPADIDVISDQLVTGLDIHNETGARVCGWK